MKVLIFGGSGFVGQQLAKRLLRSDYHVLIPSRNQQQLPYGEVLPYSIEQIGAVLAACKENYAIINLAGESINSGRWTPQRKQLILESRIRLTNAITEAIAKTPQKPNVLINASAVGFYGYSETQTFDEASGAGDGFLAEVTKEWEKAAFQATPFTRVVTARFGVVLGREGGALPRMVLPYRFLAGGRVGSGQQWVSWIHIDDVVGLLAHCLQDETVSGAVNVTAPHPVTMDHFGRIIGSVLNRPHWIPAPSFALQLLLGEMSEIVLQGQKVIPQVARDHGYSFEFPTVEKALADLLS